MGHLLVCISFMRAHSGVIYCDSGVCKKKHASCDTIELNIMWTNNTRNTKILGDQNDMFKILNGYENIDSDIFCFKFKESKISRLEGTTSRWWKNKVDWMSESILSLRVPPKYRIKYLLVVCMLV